jgi:hypothetical protein
MSVAKAGALAIALVAPVLSLAQESNAPVSRAQVRAQLVQLEAEGYKRAPHDIEFPENFQAAEARVATGSGAAGVAGVGGSSEVLSQSGSSDVTWQGAKDKR